MKSVKNSDALPMMMSQLDGGLSCEIVQTCSARLVLTHFRGSGTTTAISFRQATQGEKDELMPVPKRCLWITALCILMSGSHGLCEEKPFGWKSQIFKGYFTTKDGRTQAVDDFLNLSEFHTFIYRYDGIIMPMSIVYLKSVTALEGNRMRIVQRDGETLTADMWDGAQHRCMLFTVFQAESTHYVRKLLYVFHDQGQAKQVRAEIPVCDVKEIGFE